MKDMKGMLVPAAFQLSGSSPVAATDTSGNDIKDVVSGVSVFAKQAGSDITYVLPDTGARRVALNFDGRWHFSEPFVPDLDKLTLPPAPELVSLNCSGGQTPLSPSASECYPFARGLIVKATNFDSEQYEMYYSYFNTLTLTDITLPVKPKGVEVSGTVTSYGDETEKTYVQLIPAGGSEAAYEDIVSGNSATCSFSTVPAGEYTLKVMKKGHAPWTEEITAGSAAVTKDVTIYLIGDVNKDGVINGQDLQRLYEHLKGENPLT